MRGNLILPLVLAAIGTLLIILVFFPGASQSVGLENDELGRLGYLAAVLILIASGITMRDFKARQFLRDAALFANGCQPFPWHTCRNRRRSRCYKTKSKQRLRRKI